MKNKDKNLFKYALIMIFAVLVLVLIALFSQNKVSEIEADYKTQILENQKSSEVYQEKMVKLEEENKKLKEEKIKLEEKITEAEQNSANQTEYNQQIKILSDIYLMIENGDKNGAKAELEKISDTNFDETAENFKKALIKLLK